ncbi:MAG: formate dehydrogenase accessory sulfurtransferase FdhD [Dehalococcoidia bacterium]
MHRFRDGAWLSTPDHLAVEEPLEIRLNQSVNGASTTEPVSITMRTPGQDRELAAGLLFGEGIVSSPSDIESIEHAVDHAPESEHRNTLLVSLRPGLAVDLEHQRRHFTTTSACGVCGKSSLDALVLDGCRPLKSELHVSAQTLAAMPGLLRQRQCGFEATGGVHAVGLFSAGGELRALGEDVGRHNAFDKVVGARFLARDMEALASQVVLLSGRASYELLQKALRARIPVVAAVGAPSSLAVEIAETFNITLVGFLKSGSFNVYSGRERLRD